MKKPAPRGHTNQGELFLKVLAAIKAAGTAGATTTQLMEAVGLSRRSIQNHTSDLRLRGFIQSAGIPQARVHLSAEHPAETLQAAADATAAEWFESQEPAKAARRKKRLERQKAYSKEWRQVGPKSNPRPRTKQARETTAANTVAQAIKTLDRKPWEPKPKPLPPTVTWCAPERHYKEPTKPGRYEVLEVAGCFSSMKPGQYAFEPASVAARVVA